MEKLLQSQKALVTGGSRGIGFAIAKKFLEHGACVEIWSSSQKSNQRALEQLHPYGSVTGQVVNVGDIDQVQQAAANFLEKYGNIDTLVNNAGITRDQLLLKLSPENWENVINTNLNSLFNTTSSFIRSMMKARSGCIINISSIVGITGNPGQTNYAASKSGIIGFTKALAKEVGSRNIRVNCIAPGFIRTDMTNALKEEQMLAITKQIPLDRIGEPEDIANAALFLASPLASYVNAHVMTVDGGCIAY